MSNKDLREIPLMEHIRKRPGMYIGRSDAKGVILLIREVLIECIAFCESNEILFSVVVHGENKFSIEVNAEKDFSPLIANLFADGKGAQNLFIKALIAISEEIEIVTSTDVWLYKRGDFQKRISAASDTALIFNFEVDMTVFKETDIDYNELAGKMYQLAMLNRGAGIIIKDHRQKYPSQNYFCIPQGVFYLFERIAPSSYFEIRFDGQIDQFTYQLAVAYLGPYHKYPKGYISTFANDTDTCYGGTHVNGIIEGITAAFRKYIRVNKLSGYRVNRKQVMNGLVIVCAVRGREIEYHGSTKEKLGNPEIQEHMRKLTSTLIFDQIKDKEGVVNHFISRFDPSCFMSMI